MHISKRMSSKISSNPKKKFNVLFSLFDTFFFTLFPQLSSHIELKNAQQEDNHLLSAEELWVMMTITGVVAKKKKTDE